jgi:hypothetical protein
MLVSKSETKFPQNYDYIHFRRCSVFIEFLRNNCTNLSNLFVLKFKKSKWFTLRFYLFKLLSYKVFQVILKERKPLTFAKPRLIFMFTILPLIRMCHVLVFSNLVSYNEDTFLDQCCIPEPDFKRSVSKELAAYFVVFRMIAIAFLLWVRSRCL